MSHRTHYATCDGLPSLRIMILALKLGQEPLWGVLFEDRHHPKENVLREGQLCVDPAQVSRQVILQPSLSPFHHGHAVLHA